MKFINYILLGLTLFIGLTSCKENADEPQNTGSFLVSVETKNPEPRTLAARASESFADPQQFPLIIKGEKGTPVENITKEFPSVSKLPAEPIQLPVGSYIVSAHSPGEIAKQMTHPYFKGDKKVEIAKNITSVTTVVCKMQNTKFQLTYLDQFKEQFQTWTITINDGDGSIDVYDHTNLNPAPVYYYFGEKGLEYLTVNIKAVTKSGNEVVDVRRLSKSDANESYGDDNSNFVGGDGLNLNMGYSESTSGKAQIKVDLKILFTNHQDDIDINVNDKDPERPDVPVEPGEGEQSQGGDETQKDAPSLTLPENFSYSPNGSSIKPETVNAFFKTPKGLASAKVKVSTTDDTFRGILASIPFDEEGALLTGTELIGNQAMQSLLDGMGKSTPTVGSTEYTFPLGAFLTLLGGIQGQHTFHLVLTDQAGGTTEGEVTITITA